MIITKRLEKIGSSKDNIYKYTKLDDPIEVELKKEGDNWVG